MEKYSVYVHVFPNGKKYYGITCHENANRRFQNGFGYRGQELVWRAICKYGWENIEHCILHTGLSKDEAAALERKYICENKTNDRKYGYNISLGGEGNGSISDETRIKLSERMKGNNHPMFGKHISEDHKRKISEKLKGRVVSEETKLKLRNARKGKPGRVWTEESKKKVSESLKGRKVSQYSIDLLRERNNSYPGGSPTARKVICIDTGEIFNSLVEAGKSIGSTKSSVWRVCVGKRKSLRKKHFAYFDEYIKGA